MALRDLADRPKPESGAKFSPIDQAVREPVSETALVWGLVILAAICVVVVLRHYLLLLRERKKEAIRLRLLEERGLLPHPETPGAASSAPSVSTPSPEAAPVPPSGAVPPSAPSLVSERAAVSEAEPVDPRAATLVGPSPMASSAAPSSGEASTGTTRQLRTGSKLRLHFAQAEETFGCTVINVSDEGFVVTLPKTGERHHHPREGEKVEGFLTVRNVFGAFESRVSEVFRGGIFACRIAHSDAVKEIHKRGSLRVATDHPLTFAHYATAGLAPEEIRPERLPELLHARWDGVMKDLSLGGCALATTSRHRFHPGDMVEFSFRLLPDEPVCTVRGTLLRARPIPPEEGTGMFLQVRFAALDDAAQGTIERTVHHLSESRSPAKAAP